MERLSIAGSLKAGTGVERSMNSILGERKDEDGSEKGQREAMVCCG